MSLALLCAPVAAAADSSGVFTGRVVDARTGAPIAGVHVAASSPYGDVVGRSRDDGRFTFLGLASGRTVVTLEAEGFEPRECAYRVWPGGDTRVTFALSAAAVPSPGTPAPARAENEPAPACPAAPIGGGETQDVYVVGG